MFWIPWLKLIGFHAPTEPEEETPSPTFSEPWRKLQWGNNASPLQYVQEFQPGKEGLQHLRILLYGPIGAGKSTFINTVSSVVSRRMVTPAIAASFVHSGGSFTKKFQTHKIKKGRGEQKTYYPFVFNDIMGLEEGGNQGVRPDDLKLILKGHMPEDYLFNPVSPLSPDSHEYNSCPTLDDKVHVLVCLLSANAAEIKDSVIIKMAAIREEASNLGIPQMAIITFIDQACEETEKDLKNVYKSKHLKRKMQEFSAAVGIPLNYIFPVKNYSEEIDLDDDVDTLVLSALKRMIDFGDDFTDK